ncbi:MAG: HDIG domain-containing protein [Candidatus Pacebacteria bacterium]|nr:HDIG domain-containing protein [Candidatus Paceibacterota bacterium]
MKNFINQDAYLTEFNVHKKYASSELILDLVWTHCNIIADIALNLIQKNNLSNAEYHPGVVVQAALLHDIGVYVCDGYEWLTNQPPFNKPYVQHTLAGAWILKEEGFSADVIQVAHVHAGVGITNDDINKFGLQLPDGDYVPTTPVQRLVTYSAKFHSKAPKFKTVEEIEESLKRYGDEKNKIFREFVSEYGHPDLDSIIKKYDTWHQAFAYETGQLTNITTAPNLNSAGIATHPF